MSAQNATGFPNATDRIPVDGLQKSPLHGFLWDKKPFALIVIASTFMVRGNPFSLLFPLRSAEVRIAAVGASASLAMTLLLPAFDHPTKKRDEPRKATKKERFIRIHPDEMLLFVCLFLLRARPQPCTGHK